MRVSPISYHKRRLPAWLLAVALLGATAPWFISADSANAQQRASRIQRGWLGITMVEKPGGIVLVDGVVPGSPADKARLRIGDVVLRVGGVAMHTARDTARTVGDHGAGSVVRIAIERDGAELTVTALLDPYPSQEQLLRMTLVGRPAPTFRGLLTSDSGLGPTLDQFRGKVLVLDFWGSFCGACQLSTNTLNGWQQRYAVRGLAVVGIASEPADSMSRSARRFGIQYGTFADPDGTTSAAYHARELPTFVVVDRAGIVRDVATGFSPARLRQMEATIGHLLAQPAPKP